MHDDRGDRRKGNLCILLRVRHMSLLSSCHHRHPYLPMLMHSQLLFAQSLLYHLSVALIKSSFIFQYLRLFTFVRPLTYACYILLVLTVSAAAWGVSGVISLCDPVHAYWDLETPNAKCKSAEEHFLSTSGMGIALDWAIWVLPIPVVGKLRLPRRQKMGLLGVFGLGGV